MKGKPYTNDFQGSSNKGYLSYQNWVKNNYQLITDRLSEEAGHFLRAYSGEAFDSLYFDNRWHYLGRSRKKGYKGHFYEDKQGKPRLDLIYNPFPASEQPVKFDDWTVINNLWQEETGQKTSGKKVYRKVKVRTESSKSKQDEAYKRKIFERCKKNYLESDTATKSGYCESKSIPIYENVRSGKGAYQHTAKYECINLPVITFDRGITGFQQIFDGNVAKGKNKSFVGKNKAGFVFLDYDFLVPLACLKAYKGLQEIIICEGFATGVSLHMASNLPVLCALYLNNIGKVVKAVRQFCGPKSKVKIIIAPDNDKAKEFEFDAKGKPKVNGGLTISHRVAIEYGCYVLPIESERESIDFNDIHRKFGLDAVKQAVNSATTPNPKIAFNEDLRKLERGDRYLRSINNLPEGITLIKSPQGTGKTHAIAKTIKDYRDSGISVLAITHRESLAQNLGARFGLEVYNELTYEHLQLQSGLVICVNSLYKLPSNSYFDVIIIDESEQFVRNLKGRHIQHKAENMQILDNVLAPARKLIMLDADIGPLSRGFIREYKPHDKIHWIRNYYPIGEDKKFVVVDKKGLAIQAFYDALEHKEKVAFFCNSLDISRSVYEYARSNHSDLEGILANSETSNTNRVRTANFNPEEFKKYDFIVASPAVQTGISIEESDFNKVVGYFSSNVGISDDFIQQLWRIRDSKELIVWFDSRNLHGISNPEKLREVFQAADRKEAEQLGEPVSTVYDPKYFKMKIDALSLEARDKSRLKYNSIYKTTKQGFDISLANDTQEDKKIALKANKLTKEAGDRVYIRDRLNAKDINPDTALLIQGKQSPTQDEILQLSRYQTKDVFKWDTELGRIILRNILLAKASVKDVPRIDSLSGDDLLGEAFLLNKDGKFVRELKHFRITSGSLEVAKLELEHEKNNHALDHKKWTIIWEFYQKLYKVVGLKEAIKGEIVRYSLDSKSVKNFLEYIDSQRNEFEEPIGLPTEKKLKENPVRYIGTWLGKSGLKHARIGDFHNSNYILNPDLAMALNTLANFEEFFKKFQSKRNSSE